VSRHPFYKKAEWYRRLRPQHLAIEPLCRSCLRRGFTNDGSLTSAGARQVNPRRRFMVVDHIVPFRGDWDVFTDRANLQTLCPDCHDRNKQREDVRGYSEERGPDGWPVDPLHPSNLD
jgi:5-methylcytosine-specific restriction endonuclease McrA